MRGPLLLLGRCLSQLERRRGVSLTSPGASSSCGRVRILKIREGRKASELPTNSVHSKKKRLKRRVILLQSHLSLHQTSKQKKKHPNNLPNPSTHPLTKPSGASQPLSVTSGTRTGGCYLFGHRWSSTKNWLMLL